MIRDLPNRGFLCSQFFNYLLSWKDKLLKIQEFSGQKKKIHLVLKTKKEPALLLIKVKVGVASYSMTMDIGQAKTKLGYVPRVSTREAINEFASWWSQKSTESI